MGSAGGPVPAAPHPPHFRPPGWPSPTPAPDLTGGGCRHFTVTNAVRRDRAATCGHATHRSRLPERIPPGPTTRTRQAPSCRLRRVPARTPPAPSRPWGGLRAQALRRPSAPGSASRPRSTITPGRLRKKHPNPLLQPLRAFLLRSSAEDGESSCHWIRHAVNFSLVSHLGREGSKMAGPFIYDPTPFLLLQSGPILSSTLINPFLP